MSRKPKAAKAATPKTDLADDEMRALALNHKPLFVKALAAKKKTDADFKNCCKRIKAELGDDGVAVVKAMIELDTPEGEAKVKARARTEAKAMKWMGLPVGAQIELQLGEPDRTPAADRAFDEGKRDSMESRPRKCDYDPSTEQYRRYMAGYDEDQELRASKIGRGADDADVRPKFLRDREKEREAETAH